MTSNPISIEITRHDNKLSSVSVIMPTWNHTGSDGKLYAKIPFLGLETYGTDENDLDVAIKEALTCFCLTAEKHGLGLESELEYLGWTKVDNMHEGHSLLKALPQNKAFDSAISTGDTRALMVDMSPLTLEAA